MTIQVTGYVRHVNGKLVTVHGYTQDDRLDTNTGLNEDGTLSAPNIIRQIPHGNSQMIAAQPGIFQTKASEAIYTRGLSPHAIFPANRSVPNIKWIRARTSVFNTLILSNVAEDWSSAIQEALDHILLVIKNNPSRSMRDIINRPDVQQALRSAGAEGTAAVITALKELWKEKGGPEDSAYLNKIISTMYHNGATFSGRISNALIDGSPDDAKNIILKDRLRAAAAQSVVETRAKAEAALNDYRLQGETHVQWKAHIDDSTCAACLALDGEIVPIGESFDVNLLALAKIKPYGALIAPPAHPNCRCELLPSKG